MHRTSLLALLLLAGCVSNNDARPVPPHTATLTPDQRYLEENRERAGVQVTASGLQYRVLRAGTGRKPAASDTVTVNYRGRLVDGREFDSTYRRGEPATFELVKVIRGWIEGIPLVQEGGLIELVVPQRLGYGPRGSPGGQIPPFATLIFEVELLRIEPPTAPVPPAQ